jgi:hypothetical protein
VNTEQLLQFVFGDKAVNAANIGEAGHLEAWKRSIQADEEN